MSEENRYEKVGRSKHPGRNDIKKVTPIVNSKLTHRQQSENKINEIYGIVDDMREDIKFLEQRTGILLDSRTEINVRLSKLEKEVD